MKRTVFVTGIHGSGKTTLCAALSAYTKIPHHSASALIKSLSQREENVSRTTKAVRDIDGNQDLLIRAVQYQLDSVPTLILDGHFCIFDSGHRVVTIPAETFNKISLVGVILLTPPVEVTAARLKARDSMSYDISLLSELQNCEVKIGISIAKDLQIPIIQLADASNARAIEFIDFVIK